MGGAGRGTLFLRQNAGGTASEWGRGHGPAAEITFTAGAATITAAEGDFRFINTVSQNSTVTLSTSGAEAGDEIDMHATGPLPARSTSWAADPARPP